MKTKLLFIVAIFLLSANSHLRAQQTIHSTFAGGWWPDPVSWFEAVPTADDSVVIQGPIGTHSWSGWCKSLNITETGSLGGNGNQGNLFIYGSLYNNGNITGSINYNLQGNLINNKPWTGVDSHIFFTGMDHTITCAQGAIINAQLSVEDSLHNFTLLSDVTINTPYSSNLGFSQLDAQAHKLHIADGIFTNCRLHSMDTLQFDCTISNLEITGNYVLKGSFYNAYSVYLYGNTINLASIPNSNLPIYLKGDFTNKDTISTYVDVEKYIQNQGYWNCYETKFTGEGNKHISQSAGHPFGGTQLMTDNSGAKIILDSDVEFAMPTVHLDNDTLSCGSYVLTANSSFYDGTIADGEIKGASDFWNPNFIGNVILNGDHRFANGVVNGIVENRGNIKDITYYGGYFNVYNHLVNKNSIQSMNLKVYGNLTNSGTINNNSVVQIVGDTTQYISLLSSIESPTLFYCDETGHNYQWMKNGEDILNQTAAILNFSSLQLSDAGVYQCRYITGTGNSVYSRSIIVNNVTGLPEQQENTNDFRVFPNPFSIHSIVSFKLDSPANVQLILIDAHGYIVKTLVNSLMETGWHEIKIGECNINPGFYFVRMMKNAGTRKSISTLNLIHI